MDYNTSIYDQSCDRHRGEDRTLPLYQRSGRHHPPHHQERYQLQLADEAYPHEQLVNHQKHHNRHQKKLAKNAAKSEGESEKKREAFLQNEVSYPDQDDGDVRYEESQFNRGAESRVRMSIQQRPPQKLPGTALTSERNKR